MSGGRITCYTTVDTKNKQHNSINNKQWNKIKSIWSSKIHAITIKNRKQFENWFENVPKPPNLKNEIK